jgi:2-aminoadipate transaminase
MNIAWNERYSQRAQRVTASEIRELLKLVNRPGLTSFAGGIPASELFPFAEVEAAYQRILHHPKGRIEALQYSISEGYQPLREWVVEQMEKQGIKLTTNNVCITCGSQQSLDFLGKLFIDGDDPVVVENPSYMGALQAFNTYHPAYITVPIDEDGLRLDKLDLRSNPKFIYTIANYQNPSGVTLSLERRWELIKQARQYGVPIIEDDAYGQLRYEGDELASILAIDALNQEGDIDRANTIYLGSASKILAPGFRIAWVVGPRPVIERIVLLKQGADLHTSTVNQMVVNELVRQPFFPDHLLTLRRVYRQRRDAMLEALGKYMPSGVTWTHPRGGMFIWATVPEHIHTKELLAQALDEINVAFVPGAAFFADRSGTNTMRLNFSMMPPEQITEGIKRLGGLIEKILLTESAYQWN